MNRVFTVSVLGLLVLMTGLVKGVGKPDSDTPVVITIGDSPNSVQSDGGGSYFNGVDNVVALLQAALGDMEFDEYSSSTRRLIVSLNDPVAGSPLNPLGNFNPNVPGRITVKASQYLSGSFPSMTLGQQTNSQFGVGFRIYSSPRNYKQYRFDNNPLMHAETDPALVTCTGVKSSGLCNAWHIQTTGVHGGVQKNQAYFEDVTTNKAVHIGDYYITFDINLHE